MRWHFDVHGSSVSVSKDGLTASRLPGAPPYDGLAISREPLIRGSWICLSVSQSNEWVGCLRMGVTTKSPDTLLVDHINEDEHENHICSLPKFSCPDWSNRPNIWMQPVTDLAFAFQQHQQQIQTQSQTVVTNSQIKLSMNVNEAGQLHYFINGVHKGYLFNDLPVRESMWLLVELFGDTHAVHILTQSDVPSEITGRGGKSLSAYHRACETGTRPVYRTRLMLVGEDGAGKTSLIKALTGQKYSNVLESTKSIDLSSSCSFPACASAPTRDHWRLATRFNENICWASAPAISNQWPGIKEEDLNRMDDDCDDLYERHLNQLMVTTNEEIRLECLAQNRAVEILYNHYHQQSVPNRHNKHGTTSPAISHKSLRLSTRTAGGNSEQTVSTTTNSSGISTTITNDQMTVSKSSSSNKMVFDDLLVPTDIPDVLNARVLHLVEASKEKRQQTAVQVASLQKNKDSTIPCDVTLNIWDFGGQVIYYTTHQLFLSHRAVYLIVFNLEHDLEDAATHPVVGNYQDSSVFSHFDYLDYWFHLIHSHAAQSAKGPTGNGSESVENTEIDISELLSPPIFVVGTHARSLGSSDADIKQRADKCFEKIREYIRYKSYVRHIIPDFYVVENSADDECVNQLSSLRDHIERVVRAQAYMGEMIPVKWLRLERRIESLRNQDTHLLWINQVISLAQEEGLYNEEDTFPALEFLHDLGTVIYFGKNQAAESRLSEIVIIDPQWLVELFRAVVSAKPVDLNASMQTGEAWLKLRHSAILDERLLDTYWSSHRHVKLALIALMEKFDLAAERLPNPVNSSMPLEKSFYVPSLLKPWTTKDPNFYDSPNSVIFYLKFQNFLPDGLFQRLLTRSILWSQEQGGRDPVLYYNKAWFFVDQEHDFALEMHAYRLSRIKVSVYRVNPTSIKGEKMKSPSDGCIFPRQTSFPDEEDKKDSTPKLPSAIVVAKVRRFLETVLEELRQLWMRRMAYQVVIACPCGRDCSAHHTAHCPQLECLHFLNLDECLSNKIVCCGHRRIPTDHWKSWFPTSVYKDGYAPAILPNHVLSSDVWNIEVQKGQYIPHWMKAAAKLLNGAVEGQDWKALCEQLGYNEAQISRFNEDLNPALLLIADWVITNGNTNLAVDMLVACLYQMDRSDIAEAIEVERESELERAQVFLSYQWDSQEAARELRDRLERAGFLCWMDIGQMGGGDVLMARIERAVRQCRVVVAVVTPRFVVSPACIRELCLADLLRKPLVPVLLDRTPWPPPGSMALILSQYVYIDLCGVGGHGGSGALADRKARYEELLKQVGKYATPELLLSEVYNSGHTESQAKPSPEQNGLFMADGDNHGGLGAFEAAEGLIMDTDSDGTGGGGELGNEDGLPGQGQNHQQAGSDNRTGGAGAGGVAERNAQGPVDSPLQVNVRRCAVCIIL